ncbi:Rpn family recombination-promoting nuclease/putative transposase [Herbivorax sp. ANBcel31]|uniref:Rpn family recombination-promoting nuclease/putative transposase n=1 Tax=Herbivorax sp. ANBcel31 TaxID=3069754 RepID=UPI0027B72CCE|nr:Rpn family recombination-promoting nuclease/putative transposase [Herbivorax sp. ANBcel31]MDQ2087085.1 Rpn family recombination-promoting nuclease/putative transposase [Herbivorax sp. ANBcel31]
MKIQNPHDKFFKETFSNTAVAKDFMKNYLPKSIINIVDIDTLEPQKDSFINEDLQEVFSDMLFRVNINKREGYIYFLFEHKSYIGKNISFQLLKYMIEIWESKIKKEKADELPMIIPLVVYHGSDEWKIKTTLGEMIKGYGELPEDVKKYMPDYEYLLYDLSKYTDEQIKGEVQLRILLTIFRDIFSKDSKVVRKTVLRAAEYLKELDDRQTGIEYFETFMRYILNARQRLTKEDVNDIVENIEKTYPEGSEVVMTLAEQLKEEGKLKGIEEGKLKGKQEGFEEGETKALSKSAIRLLTKKFGKLSEETKSKIEKLDSITLEIIIDQIFEYKTLDDAKRYFD